MASPFESVRKVIHDTTTEILDSEVHKKTAGVLTAFVTSVFDIVDDTLIWVQDVTEEEEDEE